MTKMPDRIKDNLQAQDLVIDSTPKTQVLILKTQIMNGIKDKLQAQDLAIDSTPKTQVSSPKTQILKLTKK